MSCFVCHSDSIFTDSHHIVPRSRGGAEGPEVPLCQDCHRLLHSAAKKMKRGKSPDSLMIGLNEGAIARARGLIQAILMSDLNQPLNKNPLIAAVLDDPCYLTALKLFQRDAGFTSQEAAINGMLRKIAEKYGLVSEERQSKDLVPLRSLNGLRRRN